METRNDIEPLERSDAYRQYVNRGTYSPNINWAHEQTGVVMTGEEAARYRMLHDPEARARYIWNMDLPEDQAHEMLLAHDPEYRDTWVDPREPGGEWSDPRPHHGEFDGSETLRNVRSSPQYKIHEYAENYRRLTPRAPERPMTQEAREDFYARLDAEHARRRAMAESLDREIAKSDAQHTNVPLVRKRGMPSYGMTPEEMAESRAEVRRLAEDWGKSVNRGSRSAAKSDSVSPITAYEASLFDRELGNEFREPAARGSTAPTRSSSSALTEALTEKTTKNRSARK